MKTCKNEKDVLKKVDNIKKYPLKKKPNPKIVFS